MNGMWNDLIGEVSEGSVSREVGVRLKRKQGR